MTKKKVVAKKVVKAVPKKTVKKATPKKVTPLKKYEFTGKEKVFDHPADGRNCRVRQIKRLSDGLVGGWIQSEYNLSHEGNCFVYNNAMVIDNARVNDDAEVRHNAILSENSSIWGNSKILDYAQVCGLSRVADNAIIWGSAFVKDSVIKGTANVSQTIESRNIDHGYEHGSKKPITIQQNFRPHPSDADNKIKVIKTETYTITKNGTTMSFSREELENILQEKKGN